MAETATINSFQVRLGGEAGQGVESGGAGFARAVMRAGLHCFGLQDYMSRIRGGHNFYQIRVNEAPVYTFDDTLHLLLAFNKETVDLRILVPAFMISEIRRGFEIGFLIVLPFLVIDLIVATIAMAMGMMMLPPTVVSLPFKIMFFVLIDGWNLLVGSLVRSFN